MKLIAVFLLTLLATDAFGLAQSAVRKVYGNEIFTASDKNADETATIVSLNALETYFPGTDSLKVTRVVIDTVHSLTANNITVAPADTLETTTLDVTGALRIGGTGIVGTVYSLVSTAGKKALFSYATIDSAALDCLTVVGPSTMLGGLQVTGMLDSDGPVTVALAPVFSGGASFTKGLKVSSGTATFTLAPVFSGGASFTSTTVTGMLNSDGEATFALAPVFSGGASFTKGLTASGGAVFSSGATFSLAPVFSGGATFSSGLKATGGKAVFTAASSILLPTALTFASSTDGHVLTADGHGRVALEAAASSGASLSGSTNNTVATVTGANALIGEANLTFTGSALTVTGSASVTGVFSAGTSPSLRTDIAPWDAIVDSAGNGDFTTIGAALNARAKRIFIRFGTYPETVSIAQPNTILEGAGSGGGTTVVGAKMVIIDGGTSAANAVTVESTADGSQIRHLAIRTTTGGGAASGTNIPMRVQANADYIVIDDVNFLASDADYGALSFFSDGGVGVVVRNSWFHGGDGHGIYSDLSQLKVVNNWFGDGFSVAGKVAIYVGGGCDGCMINNNLIEEATTTHSIYINSGADYGIACGNVMDVPIVNDTGSTHWALCGDASNTGSGAGNQHY